MARRSLPWMPLLWLAGACASARPAEPPPLRADLDARLTFTLVQADPPEVRVELRVRGGAGGGTDFALREAWAGIEEPEKSLTDVKAVDRAGAPLPVERRGPRAWRVAHGPGVEVRFSYGVKPLTEPVGDESSSYYRPILRPGLFHLIGNVGLPRPGGLAEAERVRVEVAWEGFDEQGWSTVSSHGAARSTVVHLPWDDLTHAVFVAGELDVRSAELRGTRLVVAVHGAWPFTTDEFAGLCARIVRAEREFMNDFGDPFYLVTLIPVGEAKPGSHSLGGTGLTSSFATFALPGTSLEPELDGRNPKAPPRPPRLMHLLAHEMFHRWNGEILRGAEPEALVYWFSEGFTDYYAARLLWIAGLYTLGDYLDEVNRTIRDYASNPKKGAPNAAIAEGFWKDRDVQRLPYQRGHLAALQWNAEARRRSGGKRSLDDAVLALCQGARARGDKIDVDKLLTLAAAEAGEDYARRLRAIVVDGADVELAPDTLEPFAKLEVADASPFDPCLDLGATRARGVVTGLRLGSEAERAGLAEGQAVQSLSIQDGDASAPARATIAVREGLTETLWYFPRAERRLVARFVPR